MKIQLALTIIDRTMLEPTKNYTPRPVHKKLAKDGRRDKWWSQIPYPPGEWPANRRTILKEVLPLFWKFRTPCHFPDWYPTKGTLNPRESDLEGQQVYLQDFHRTGVNRDSRPWRHNLPPWPEKRTIVTQQRLNHVHCWCWGSPVSRDHQDRRIYYSLRKFL